MKKGHDIRKLVNRAKLIDYLGNPANEWPTRKFMNDYVLEFIQSRGYIYKIFNLEELCEIEKEGLAMRRTKYSGGMALVDKALIKQALAGSEAAIKLCYQRFEDWGETKKIVGGVDLNWTTEIIDPNNEEVKE